MSERPADTDLDLLRTRAYAQPDKLDARRAIYDYQDPRPDFHGWTLDQLEWPTTGTVVDLGCGPGTHLVRLAQRCPELDLVGSDLSEGMLATTRAGGSGASVLCLDAAALALRGASTSVVMANHMLYHVAELDRTLAEIRRVLVPGGVLLAVTNGRDHVGELVVPDRHPLVQFAASMRDLTFIGFDDAAWERTMVRFEQLVDERLERDGAIRITAHAGAFVCR